MVVALTKCCSAVLSAQRWWAGTCGAVPCVCGAAQNGRSGFTSVQSISVVLIGQSSPK